MLHSSQRAGLILQLANVATQSIIQSFHHLTYKSQWPSFELWDKSKGQLRFKKCHNRNNELVMKTITCLLPWTRLSFVYSSKQTVFINPLSTTKPCRSDLVNVHVTLKRALKKIKKLWSDITSGSRLDAVNVKSWNTSQTSQNKQLLPPTGLVAVEQFRREKHKG